MPELYGFLLQDTGNLEETGNQELDPQKEKFLAQVATGDKQRPGIWAKAFGLIGVWGRCHSRVHTEYWWSVLPLRAMMSSGLRLLPRDMSGSVTL